MCVSPTDVSLTESSWMLHPLNKAPLGNCAPDRCVPTPNPGPRHGTTHGYVGKRDCPGPFVAKGLNLLVLVQQLWSVSQIFSEYAVFQLGRIRESHIFQWHSRIQYFLTFVMKRLDQGHLHSKLEVPGIEPRPPRWVASPLEKSHSNILLQSIRNIQIWARKQWSMLATWVPPVCNKVQWFWIFFTFL